MNKLFPIIFENPSKISLSRRQVAAAAPPFHLHRPRSWSSLPSLDAPVTGGRGTSFHRFVGKVRACLSWCIVGMVGAVPGQINLHQRPSHTGGGLHRGVSEFMATRDRQLGLLVVLQFWIDLFLDVSLARSSLPRQRGGPRRGGCLGARMLVRRW
jgi:hypothetical protein